MPEALLNFVPDIVRLVVTPLRLRTLPPDPEKFEFVTVRSVRFEAKVRTLPPALVEVTPEM